MTAVDERVPALGRIDDKAGIDSPRDEHALGERLAKLGGQGESVLVVE